MSYPEPKDPRTGKAPEHVRNAKKKSPKSPYASYKGIDKAIAEMLTENTGMNVLDSGGVYGRGWQKNQGRDFKKESAEIVNVYEPDAVNVLFNIFHFLTIYLKLDNNCKKLQKKFYKFAESPEHEDDPWLVSMEEFGEMTNEYPSMLEYIGTVNTYNYDNIINGIIQYTSFMYDNEQYILLQTHNGMDARGGYSKPRVFKVADSDYFIMAQTQVYASSSNFSWDSYDAGYSWEYGQAYDSDMEGADVPDLEFDVRGEKVYLKGTDDEITFSVMESY